MAVVAAPPIPVRMAFDVGTVNFACVVAQVLPKGAIRIIDWRKADIRAPKAKNNPLKFHQTMASLYLVLNSLNHHKPGEVRIEKQILDRHFLIEIAGSIGMWGYQQGAYVKLSHMRCVWKKLHIKGKRDEQGRLVYDKTKQHSFQPLEEMEDQKKLFFQNATLREEVLNSPDLRDCVLHLL